MNRKERRAASKNGGPSMQGISVRAQPLYEDALRLHQAGRLDAAEPLFRQVLKTDPRHARTLHFLGEITRRTGRLDAAVALIEKAIAIDPKDAAFHYNLGNTRRDQGKMENAAASYSRALALAPDFVETRNNLGLVLQSLGRLDEAAVQYRRALAFRPDFAALHNNLGNVLKQQGKTDEAAACYRAAINFNFAYPEAHHNLGVVLSEQGEADEAIVHYRRALALRPEFPEALNSLGVALKNQSKFDEAIACYRRALAVQPGNPETHNNLGNAFRELGRLDEAISSYRNALAAQPDHAQAPNNLGIALQDQGRSDDALAEYRTALAAAPDNADFHWNIALAHLQRGDFSVGWREYEWRTRTKHYPQRSLAERAWAGEELNGRTILLYAEQGSGDTIQFVRYVRLVKERGAAHVVVECQVGLERLLKDAQGIDCIVTKGDALPPFDCHASLLSLPYLFGTVLETIPAPSPYLFPQSELVEVWRKRLNSTQDTIGKTNVGLVWRGSAEHKNDRWRSIAPALFAEVFTGLDANWHSLQKDVKRDEIETLSCCTPVCDWGLELDDWADTAALVSNMDVVVTVDTAMAHLAGALGKPAWVLLPFNPDWRWLLNRPDSPWYPTLRLFRQQSPGDWGTAFAQLRQALGELLGR